MSYTRSNVTTSTGDVFSLYVPSGAVEGQSVTVVFYLHGRGGDHRQLDYWPERTNMRDALLADGHLLVVPDMHGDTWGNAVAQADIAAAHKHVTDRYNVRATYLIGESMGGNAAANVLTHQTIPVEAMFLAVPSVNLVDVWERNDATSANLGAQYGVAEDGSDFLEKTADWDGLRADPAHYAGRRITVVGATDDTVVSYLRTVRPFVDKLEAAPAEVEHITVVGGHNSPDRYPVEVIRELFTPPSPDSSFSIYIGGEWVPTQEHIFISDGWAVAATHVLTPTQ